MIRIIVDSGADYLPGELAGKGLEMVPLKVAFGEKSFLDGVDLTREEFFDMLSQKKTFPVTSQPSPEDYLKIFEDAKEKGDTVICVTIASVLSGTFQSAAIARQMADYDAVYLVDSKSATTGIQLIVDQAVKMRDAGADAESIVQEMERLRSRVCIYFMVNTLEYLYRGGRLSRTGSLAGRLVHMKPVLSLSPEGEVIVTDLCLGRSRAIAAAAGHLCETPPDPSFPVYSLYSIGPDGCEKLEARLGNMDISISRRRQIGGVIGAHVGPGVAGFAYVKNA